MAKQPKRLTKKEKTEIGKAMAERWAVCKNGLDWTKVKFRHFSLTDPHTLEVQCEYYFVRDKDLQEHKAVRFVGRSQGVEIILQQQALTESITT